jgi:hypothetical protein
MDIFANFLLMWGAVNIPCHKLILFLHRVSGQEVSNEFADGNREQGYLSTFLYW